jgi:hypothetical protein
VEYFHASLVPHRSNVEGSCAQEMSLIGVCHEILQTSFASSMKKIDWLTGPHLKLIIDLNSLNIHSVSKITQYVQKKKEALRLSATDSGGMKPKILGGSSMATFQ